MKKLLLLTALVAYSFSTVQAQEDIKEEIKEDIKSGAFYVGANIGYPLSGAGDVSAFNVGFDVAYLFEIMDNLEVGGLTGYTHFFGDGTYTDISNTTLIVRDYEDASFIPIAATARYYFADHKFFGGLDLGVGINVSGDAKTGFYYRPKFGFDLGVIALIASYQGISGGVSSNNNAGYYNGYYVDTVSVSGFNSFNIGVEFGF